MKKKELEGERCDFCETGTLQFRQCREILRQNGELIVIQNVPTFVCNFCGMHYHLANVAKKMRQIAENKEQITHQISVPIAEFEINSLVER